jgi:serine phosphatase RsbU (regulator of sigma subunit)
LFGEFCILYEPKNILSGDFYFCFRKNNTLYLAVCDCTGHGFSGALLTILGHNMLERCIRRRNNLSDIFTELNHTIINSFDSTSNIAGQGMDLAMISIDMDSKILSFIGARRPVFIYSEGKLNAYKTNRQSIGEDINYKWSHQSIQMSPGDKVFLFTDGFTDQFGEKNKEKYGIKRLKDFLETNSHLNLPAIENLLNKDFESHKMNEISTDDMLFMGIEIRNL